MKIVIDIPKEVKNRLGFGVTYEKDIITVCEALNDGTPLLKGHWIPDKSRPALQDCSICGALSIAKTNYCSNCGADMRGDENGE